MKKIILFILMLSCVILANAWGEDTFRCGTDFVTLGDSNVKVITKCGPPSQKEDYGYGYTGEEEKWYYNCCDGGFL